MDQQHQHKLAAIVGQNPILWDRNHPYFRDKEQKDKAWGEIGLATGFSAESCREAFKSLREKYIREREKSHQYGEYYREWDLLKELRYLDPHILPRKLFTQNDADILKMEGIRTNLALEPQPENCDFDNALVNLVKKTTPIWDRNSNTYPNKHMKIQMWQNIAQALNKDVNVCMLRWKALREKYIRQKSKFQEGEAKWELLDAMSFLDRVIQYRKKHEYGSNTSNNQHRSYQQCTENNYESGYMSGSNNFEDDNSYTDSSNDFLSVVKQESGAVLQVADSSFNADSCVSRKRSPSINSEVSLEKRSRNEEKLTTENLKREPADVSKSKTPEELFGDLVAAMLSKKPEKDRNLYMIEIMTVLAK